MAANPPPNQTPLNSRCCRLPPPDLLGVTLREVSAELPKHSDDPPTLSQPAVGASNGELLSHITPRPLPPTLFLSNQRPDGPPTRRLDRKSEERSLHH